MRKVLIILFAFAMFFGCNPVDGQDLTRTGGVNGSIGTYDSRASDTISANQDTVYVDFFFNPKGTANWLSDINIHFDKVTDGVVGTDSIIIEPFGKIFASDSYSSIGTEDIYYMSADTTITFSEHSTGDYIRYIRIAVIHVGTGGKVKFGGDNSVSNDDIEIKGWW